MTSSLFKEVFKQTALGFEFYVHLTPGAKKNAINGIIFDENNVANIKISVTSIPENNKANISLVEFIAKTLKLPKSSIVLKSGHKSRKKLLAIKTNEESLELLIKDIENLNKQKSLF